VPYSTLSLETSTLINSQTPQETRRTALLDRRNCHTASLKTGISQFVL
jgi:hypothetical protein